MNFILENSWLCGVILLSGGALLLPVLQRRGSKISLLQATQLINQEKAHLLDVRDPVAFSSAHLRDSKNIPLKELPNRLSELDKWKSKSVIVLCDSGVQSAKAVAMLKKSGIEEVYSLNGGLTAWQSQGLPTTK